MPNIKPYRLHRTWHLAGMLNTLTERGELSWKYSYDNENSRALFAIKLPGQEGRTLHTKDAEGIAQTLADKLKIAWRPVPHHGGEEQWKRTVAEIEAMEQGTTPKPWE
ncbi:MAG: hypothetical protein ABWY04_05820 [Arthrobacter sp.]